MLTIGYSTKKINPEFKDYIEKSCGIHKVEVIPFENPGTHSLSEVYNISFFLNRLDGGKLVKKC